MEFGPALVDVLASDVVVGVETNSLRLREKKAGMDVTVVGIPADGVAINLERVGHASKLGGSCRKVCDYLLVFERDAETWALFLELKKTDKNYKRPREQLRRSLPILKYLRSVCLVEQGSTQKEHPVAVRYAIVFEKVSERLDKQSVRADPKTRIRQEKYMDIEVRTFVGPRVSVQALVGD